MAKGSWPRPRICGKRPWAARLPSAASASAAALPGRAAAAAPARAPSPRAARPRPRLLSPGCSHSRLPLKSHAVSAHAVMLSRRGRCSVGKRLCLTRALITCRQNAPIVLMTLWWGMQSDGTFGFVGMGLLWVDFGRALAHGSPKKSNIQQAEICAPSSPPSSVSSAGVRPAQAMTSPAASAPASTVARMSSSSGAAAPGAAPGVSKYAARSSTYAPCLQVHPKPSTAASRGRAGA